MTQASGKISFIRSVINVSHIDFSSYDLENNALVYSSGLAARLLGYSPEELKEFSRNYNRQIIHPDDLPVVDEKIRELEQSKDGEVVEMIVRYRRRNGQYIWGYTRKIISERDEHGKPVKVTTVAEDISELVSLQEELEERVRQLESISSKHHHELRGPVASILGLANMMQDDDMITQYNKEIMNHLCRTVSKLDDIVGQITRDSDR